MIKYYTVVYSSNGIHNETVPSDVGKNAKILKIIPITNENVQIDITIANRDVVNGFLVTTAYDGDINKSLPLEMEVNAMDPIVIKTQSSSTYTLTLTFVYEVKE